MRLPIVCELLYQTRFTCYTWHWIFDESRFVVCTAPQQLFRFFSTSEQSNFDIRLTIVCRKTIKIMGWLVDFMKKNANKKTATHPIVDFEMGFESFSKSIRFLLVAWVVQTCIIRIIYYWCKKSQKLFPFACFKNLWKNQEMLPRRSENSHIFEIIDPFMIKTVKQ